MSRINLNLAHDRLGTIARDVITLEKHIEKEHPSLYEDVALDLDAIISRIYEVRNQIRRYDYRITFKSIYQ